jgi:glycosyltransferase involved in cell wall biosynthesis
LPVVVLPSGGPLADDLAEAGIEVLVRPGLAVLRRELLRPAGLVKLAGATASDARWLRALIRAQGIELVHSNTSVILAGASGARLAGVPHVWHVREIYSRFGRAWPAYQQLLRSAARLPCVSRATAAQFDGARNAVVIYDGLAVDPFRAPRADARAALGLPGNAPILAVLGRVSDWKGQDVLVRALAEAPLAERGAIGVIAGDAWPGAEHRLRAITGLAQQLGVADRLRVLGFRDDLENVLGAADIVVVPSTAPDPLPNSALEAAAAACAVIAADHGGLPEIITDRQTGRLVPPGDPGALARTARELLEDPAERVRLGIAAADDVRTRFAPERLLGELRDLYAAVSR